MKERTRQTLLKRFGLKEDTDFGARGQIVGRTPSDGFLEFLNAKNPDYRVVAFEHHVLVDTFSEMIGSGAGRVCFRDRKRCIYFTMDDYSMKKLRDQITAALRTRGRWR